VIPSRTTYFGVYNVAKKQFTKMNHGIESSPVYLASAASAASATAVLTNPIWLVKTRMQLQDKSTVNGYKNSVDCVRRVWKEEGIKGMYKGMGATMLGVGESTLQWLLYENLQKWTREYRKTQASRKGHIPTPHVPGVKTTQGKFTLIHTISTHSLKLSRRVTRLFPYCRHRKAHGCMYRLSA